MTANLIHYIFGNSWVTISKIIVITVRKPFVIDTSPLPPTKYTSMLVPLIFNSRTNTMFYTSAVTLINLYAI